MSENDFGAETGASTPSDDVFAGYEDILSTESASPAQATDPATPAQPTAPAEAAQPLNLETQRYKSLQGMYNRSQEDMQQLRQEQSDLQAEIERLKAEGEAQATAQQYELTDTDREALKQFNPEQVALFEKLAGKQAYQVARETAVTPQMERIQKIEQELDQSRSQVEQQGASRFRSDLEMRHPGYEVLGDDPSFQAFLRQAESPYSSRPLSDVLTQAYQSHDLVTVDRVLSGFKSSQGGTEARKNPVNAMQAPPASSSQQAAPVSEAPQGKLFPKSRYDQALRAYTNGNLGEAYFDKVVRTYERLLNEGRVDMKA